MPILRLLLILLTAGSLASAVSAQDSPPARKVYAPADNMIVGGWPAETNEWPWQVRLYQKRDDEAGFCGGSLIGKSWVLTAAHCVVDRSSVDIGYGNVMRHKQRRIGSAKIIVHEKYDGESQANDIALVKLSKNASLGDGAQPIGLADNKFYNAALGKRAAVTGWGQLLDRDELLKRYPEEDIPFELLVPERLMEVDVRVQDLGECRRNYGAPDSIPDGHLCAGYQAGGNDSCQGDSGGPLVFRDPGSPTKWRLLGIVSFGQGCALPKLYGAYTRVDYFRDWILRQTKTK